MGEITMEINNIINQTLKEKPESKRAINRGRVDFTKFIRMGLNENVFGMSPKAVAAIQENAVKSNVYSDFFGWDVKQTIADFYGLEMKNVATGIGSSGLIEAIGSTFLDVGDEVLMCMPTFFAFVDMAYNNRAVPVTIDLTEDLRFDLDGLLEAITDKTKIIVVCNPNNPTGTYVGEAALRDFLSKVPDDVIVLMDEAYIEFAEAEDCVSMVEAMKEMPNKAIIVLKTFSKFYGMAGVRVGYALAQPELIAALGKRGGGSLPKVSQEAAIAAMGDIAHGEYVKKANAEVRAYLVSELKALGCKVYDSQTNFIYFKSSVPPMELASKMMETYGIHIGAFECSRVSTGTMEQCELFIKCFKEILA